MRRLGIMIAVLANACHSPGEPMTSDASSPDGTVDAMLALGWNTPEEYGPRDCYCPTLSADMLELYCGRLGDIYLRTRSDDTSPFGLEHGAAVSPSSTATDETCPDLSEDGLTMYFTREVLGGPQGSWMKIHRATRTPGGTFDAGTQVLELDQAMSQYSPSISRDGTAIVWAVPDVTTPFWVSRLLPSNTWSTPAPVLGISGEASSPMYAPDGSALYFDRHDVQWGIQRVSGIYVATVDATSGVYNVATLLTEIDGPASLAWNRTAPWISSDGQHLYFTSRASTIEGNQSLRLMHALHK